ncbi:YrbL family protein [Pseudovibrio denitrificans]|uniref:YrbL family protein n=1 Tax=Pseudovibrio denitrificans TaxID=258256 RepID=UPI001ABEE849|nr:YrbL family protein [Pseudovibrio denitrificans]
MWQDWCFSNYYNLLCKWLKFTKKTGSKLTVLQEKQVYQVGDFVRGGGFRDTYECASDTTKLLKFDRYETGKRKVKTRGPLKNLFRAVRAKLGYKKQRLSGNQDELLGWQHIQDIGLEEHRSFAKVYGMVETDRGPALLTEKIENFWHPETRSVRDYISRHGRVDDNELVRALIDYFGILRRHHVSCFADRPENMGIVLDEQGNKYIKSFDVKPYLNNQFLPVHKIDYLSKKRIRRRLDRHLDILSGKNTGGGHKI